jgi:putative hemolysin
MLASILAQSTLPAMHAGAPHDSGAGALWVPVLIAANAFFVAGEYALIAIRPGQIASLRKQGHLATAAAGDHLRSQLAAAIGVIQLCITLVNLLLGWLGEPALSAILERLFGPLVKLLSEGVFDAVATAIAFALVTLLTTVFSEMLPKALTLRYIPVVATFTFVPVRVICRVLRPFVGIMNFTANLLTRPLGLGRVQDLGEGDAAGAEEIRLMTRQAVADGELSEQERSLILNSLSLGRRKARQIMIPRVRVAYLDVQKTMRENRAIMNERLYSRLPLCDGGLDNVIGVVPVKEFLAAYLAEGYQDGGDEGDSSVLQLLARPPVYAPESVPLDKLLILFDTQHTQLILLVDEHGGMEGIVTLRDVVDELVGEPMANPGGGGQALVGGDTSIHEVAAAIGLPEWQQEATVVSVGGLMIKELGRIPRVGESMMLEGVGLRVVEADVRKIRRVAVWVERRKPADLADQAAST